MRRLNAKVSLYGLKYSMKKFGTMIQNVMVRLMEWKRK